MTGAGVGVADGTGCPAVVMGILTDGVAETEGCPVAAAGAQALSNNKTTIEHGTAIFNVGIILNFRFNMFRNPFL